MLSEDGFKRKNYAEFLDEVEDTAHELFGADVNTTSRSPLGIFLRIFAWFLLTAHELAEKVYNSGFVSKATGVSLDRQGSNFGITRSPSASSVVTLEFEGSPGHVIEEGVQFQTESGIIFQMIDVVVLDAEGLGSGQAVSAEKASNVNVAANTIKSQAEPNESIRTVNNPNPASGGADFETDTAYRHRIRQTVNSSPGPTINGISTAILNVVGVRSANIIQNKRMEIDSYGNPPKSVRIVVDGGRTEDIAYAILDSIAAGIETVGKQEAQVEDIAGRLHSVFFDYAERIPIFIALHVSVSDLFDMDGENEVKTAIQDHVNNLGMGVDVLFSHLYPVLYKIRGIEVATVKIGKSPENLTASDITIATNEIAETAHEQIEVIINGD